MGFDLGNIGNMADLKEVWDKMPEKSWKGAIAAIQEVRKEKGNNELLEEAERKAGEAESEGRSFPSNPQDLIKQFGFGS